MCPPFSYLHIFISIFIIYIIQIITFTMNPNITIVTISGVLFITTGLNMMLHEKVTTIKRKYQLSILVFLDKQLASYLQVTSFKSCYLHGVCFEEALPLFFE